MTDNNYKKYDLHKNRIESRLLICPNCHDTKSVTIPNQTILLSVNPAYRAECSKCEIWWDFYKQSMGIIV